MFKTVSTDCNLDCSYCYYRESQHGERGDGSPRHRLSPELLERFIPEYLRYVADARVASFSWQGGEPMLAGLPFFERVVARQAAHARPPMTIANSLQTNATLVDDAWAAFLKAYDFLVGVSLDGPREAHDAVRSDARGRGSFDRVMAGATRLLDAGVAVNVLCVVGPHNVERPADLLRFFKSAGFGHVQLIPCMDFQAASPDQPPRYAITAAQYGAFLRDLFDAWYEDGHPTVSIRTFDNLLRNYAGMPAELCVHAAECHGGLVVEHNGDAYPCDFYASEEWRLGNVTETPLSALAASPSYAAFRQRKRRSPPPRCRECQWLSACNAGCPRNWTLLPDGTAGPDVFCESYRALFEHADARLRKLRETLLRRQRYLDQLSRRAAASPSRAPLVRPNDFCPCGSGRKHKLCCGDPLESQSYLFSTYSGSH